MKKQIKKTVGALFSFILTSTLIFTACKKEGPPGKDGTNGKDGNANVVSSSVTTGGWTYISPSWEMQFTYAAITQNILDNGAVLVYVKSGSNYYQLPYTYYPSSTYSRTYSFVHYVGGLKVYVTDSDLLQPADPGTLTFKVVVIAASQLENMPDVDLNNYEEVKQAFNLKD